MKKIRMRLTVRQKVNQSQQELPSLKVRIVAASDTSSLQAQTIGSTTGEEQIGPAVKLKR